jgi:conjugal transfer pilus assembly protein TraE
MKYLKFKMNWDNTSSVASKSMTVNVVLAIGLICAVFKIAQDHERIVLTPPQLSAKAEIAWNSANDEYMKRWGLFVSSMLGSITPGTASFIRDSLEPLFSAAIWPQISTQIMSVNDDPSYTRTGTINVFTPRNIIWEPGTKKVFVEGNLATTAYRNTTVPLGQFPVTYEMTMEVRYGLPVVTHFTSYLGAPRTLRWRQTHTSEVEALEKKERATDRKSVRKFTVYWLSRPVSSVLGDADAEGRAVCPSSSSTMFCGGMALGTKVREHIGAPGFLSVIQIAIGLSRLRVIKSEFPYVRLSSSPFASIIRGVAKGVRIWFG